MHFHVGSIEVVVVVAGGGGGGCVFIFIYFCYFVLFIWGGIEVVSELFFFLFV